MAVSRLSGLRGLWLYLCSCIVAEKSYNQLASPPSAISGGPHRLAAAESWPAGLALQPRLASAWPISAGWPYPSAFCLAASWLNINVAIMAVAAERNRWPASLGPPEISYNAANG